MARTDAALRAASSCARRHRVAARSSSAVFCGLLSAALQLPEHIVARIRDALARGGKGFGIDREAASHGAIALMGTLGATWLLRPDGTFWDVDEDTDKPLTPLPEDLRTMALVAGIERYPWLAELLPPRPVNADDCPTCEGRGSVPIEGALPGSSGLFCPTCKALGWVEIRE